MSSNFTCVDGNLTQRDRRWRAYAQVSQVLNIFLLVWTISLLACVIRRGFNLKSRDLSPVRRKLYIAFAVTISCTIPRLIVDITCYGIRNIVPTLDICEVIFDLSTGCGALSTAAIYLFLWLRQRITYHNVTIQKLTPKWIYVLSWTTLAVFVSTTVFLICSFLIPLSYELDACFCLSIEESETSPQFKWLVTNKKYIVGGLIALIQITMLLLFTYPMIHTRNKLLKAVSRQNKQNDIIADTIHRSFVGVTIAVIIDLAGLIVYEKMPPRAPLLIFGTVQNLVIFINICCIVYMFQHPLDFFLCCVKKRSKEEDENLTE